MGSTWLRTEIVALVALILWMAASSFVTGESLVNLYAAAQGIKPEPWVAFAPAYLVFIGQGLAMAFVGERQ